MLGDIRASWSSFVYLGIQSKFFLVKTSCLFCYGVEDWNLPYNYIGFQDGLWKERSKPGLVDMLRQIIARLEVVDTTQHHGRHLDDVSNDGFDE